MRSGAIVSFFSDLNIQKLEGGYKAYRAYVREQLKELELPKSVVLYGLTGSGKTELIKDLNNTLDLEGIAQHRGSVLGDIALKPHGQKKFESLLYKRSLELKDKLFIILECESRKIGKVSIPDKIFEKVKNPWKSILLDKTIQQRIEILKETYCKQVPTKKIIDKLQYIEKHLGKKNLQQVTEYLEQNNLDEAIRILLEKYYDLHYERLFHDFDYTVKSDKEFLEIIKKL